MSDPKIQTLLDDTSDAPAAIVLREFLVPVEGKDGVFFPPTFAAAENSKEFPGGYNINEIGNGDNVCLVDSVGSQANRIEPMFASKPYAALIPQLVVQAGKNKSVNLLEAGHRAGDAIVRCTELKNQLQSAFLALKSGNAVPLAKLAPTSLVFGVWDSRDTQAKAPRLLAATIRAFNVARLTRSAQYIPAVDYVEEGLLDGPQEKTMQASYSERGFSHVPASSTHGGVIAKGDIRREVTLQIAALRLLRGSSEEETKRLRAYLLGLSLVAFTKPAVGFLRQGCNLVLDADRPAEAKIVFPNGKRVASGISHEVALRFAEDAAREFGVELGKTVSFDAKLAKAETEAKSKDKKAPKKAKP